MRIPFYLQNVKSGRLHAGARLSILRETPSVLVTDGGWGFGQVLARDLTNRLIAKAASTGIACGSLRQSGAHRPLGRIRRDGRRKRDGVDHRRQHARWCAAGGSGGWQASATGNQSAVHGHATSERRPVRARLRNEPRRPKAKSASNTSPVSRFRWDGCSTPTASRRRIRRCCTAIRRARFCRWVAIRLTKASVCRF